jgi:hypothetical protein
VREPLESLPRQWWSIELPGYRPPREEFATYRAFATANLPPLGRLLDEQFEWLREQPPLEGSLAERSAHAARPATVENLHDLLSPKSVPVPAPFEAFIGSPELHSRVRSCTDCYLDLADFVTPVAGGGSLVHFLSDSQWVLHWLLYTDSDAAVVVVTELPLGFETDDNRVEVFDPSQLEVSQDPELAAAVCAESCTEFVYRFWIEKEIWFALAHDRRPLTEEQRAYVEHYAREPTET